MVHTRMRYVVRQFKTQWLEDAFCGTPDWTAVRILLVISLLKNLTVTIGDFATAFMSTPWSAEDCILVEPPPECRGDGSFVWKLKKGLNGLVIASKRFQQFVTQILILKMGFATFPEMPTLFHHGTNETSVVIHIDDPLASSPERHAKIFWSTLGKWLEVKHYESIGGVDMPSVYLGSRLYKDGKSFVEKPRDGYADSMVDIMENAGHKIRESRYISTPGEKLNLSKEGAEDPLPPDYHTMYRSIVGKGQFILPRRGDPSFALKELGRRLAAPRWADWEAAESYVRYMWHHRDLVLRITANPAKLMFLEGWSDTDWAGCPETLKSTGCAVIYWADALAGLEVTIP